MRSGKTDSGPGQCLKTDTRIHRVIPRRSQLRAHAWRPSSALLMAAAFCVTTDASAAAHLFSELGAAIRRVIEEAASVDADDLNETIETIDGVTFRFEVGESA
jgi:hypothetical protein